MNDKALMQQALETLEEIADEVFSPYDNKLGGVILALRERLNDPNNYWRDHASEYEKGVIDGMSKQAQRSVDRLVNALHMPWQGLTDEDYIDIERWVEFSDECEEYIPVKQIIQHIETRLREKNT